MKKKETHQIKLKTQAKQSKAKQHHQTNQQLTTQSHTRTDGLHNNKPNKEPNHLKLSLQNFIILIIYFF
jgi:hypothetical protein